MNQPLLKDGRPLRVMQMAFSHDDYIRIFQKKNKRCTTHAQCMAHFEQDGYWGGHLMVPGLRNLGYETFLCLPGDLHSQALWCMEHKVDNLPRAVLNHAICLYQVAVFQPDVLYISHPHFFDDVFLEALPHAPSVVLGWSAAATSTDLSWKLFDAILSSHEVSMLRAKECGAPETIFALPGFPVPLAEELRGHPLRTDVSFTGYWTPFHKYRNNLLKTLAARAKPKGPLDVAYYLPFFNGAEPMPDAVNQCNRGPLWGKSMFRSMAASRITLNAHAELDFGFQNLSPNMRQMEATGTGSLLLTQQSPNIEAFFTPDKHLVTFNDATTMVEAIEHYLTHPEERNAIAAQGQAHCLHHYAMPTRVNAFLHTVERIIERKSGRAAPLETLLRGLGALHDAGAIPTEHADLIRTVLDRVVRGTVDERRAAGEKLARLDISGFVHGQFFRALEAMDNSDTATAKSLLHEELETFPHNDAARHCLSRLILGEAPQPQRGVSCLS